MSRSGVVALVVLSSGCVPATPAYRGGVEARTLCSTVHGEEHCVEGVEAIREEEEGLVRVRVEGEVFVEGMALGRDTAWIRVDLLVDPASVPGPPVSAEIRAPITFVCNHDVVHGDHCHYKVDENRVCEVPVDDTVRRWSAEVTRLDEEGVALQVRGLADMAKPPCCQQICQRRDAPALASPEGPYMVAVGVNAPFAD